MEATFNKIDDKACSALASLDAGCRRGLFSDWTDRLRAGHKLRTDWFPVLWPKENSE